MAKKAASKENLIPQERLTPKEKSASKKQAELKQEEPLEKQLWKPADKLRKNIDAGWQFGAPPSGKANFAWLQHFVYHLAPTGKAGVVNTQIPAALWFLNRVRANGHQRKNEILFIDARNLGHLINCRTKELSGDDICQIANTYHAWLGSSSAIHAKAGIQKYQDIPGFCCSVPISRVAELDYVLTSGRYVGLPDEEDDFNFAERFNALKAEFEAQLQEEAGLNKAIIESLARVKV